MEPEEGTRSQRELFDDLRERLAADETLRAAMQRDMNAAIDRTGLRGEVERARADRGVVEAQCTTTCFGTTCFWSCWWTD